MNNKDILNLKDSYFEIYEKQEMQGSLLTRKGTAQNFTGGRSPFTVAEPIKQGQRSSLLLPSSSSQAQSPGQLNIPGTSQRSIDADIWSRARSSIPPSTPKERQSPKPDWDKLSSKAEKPGAPGIKGPFGRGSSSSPTPPTPPTPRTSQATLTGGAPGPRPGQTIRATGPTGNFPQLNRFVNNPSSQQMQSVSKLSTLARAGKGGVLGLLLEPTPTSSTDTPGTAPGVSRFNTRDASGRIRNRLVVGQGKVGQGKVGSVSQAFDKSYSSAKKDGLKSFKFQGGTYSTESYDLYDTILEHLITEGYADTNENALVIMANMSEDWKQSIMEDEYKGDPRKIPTEKGGSRSVGPNPKDKLVVPPFPVLPPPTRNDRTYGGPAPSIGGGSIRSIPSPPSVGSGSIRSMPSPPSGPRGREFGHGNGGTKYTTPTKDGSAGSITLNKNKPGDDFIGPTVSSGGNTYGIPNPKFGRPQR